MGKNREEIGKQFLLRNREIGCEGIYGRNCAETLQWNGIYGRNREIISGINWEWNMK